MSDPIFVLIHGSWHGGWCWRAVARRLRDAGHEVFAPTLTGCAENAHRLAGDIDLSTHIADVTRLFFYEDLRDVVLVGHSYAGLVLDGAAPQVADRLRALVYLDAYKVPPGGKGFDIWPSERAAEARRQIATGELFRAPASAEFLGLDDPPTAAWAMARLTPHPLKTYDEPVRYDEATTAAVARTYIHCTQGPLVGMFGPIAGALRRGGWDVRELAAGHDAMLTRPVELATLLLAIAADSAPR